MKCIRCDHDSKKKDRIDRICPNCKKEFAFEPQLGDKVTDPLFRNAIDAVSGNGRLRWGVEHLYYEICRRKRGKIIGLPQTCGLIAGGIFFLGGFVWTLGNMKIVGFPAIPFLFPFGLFIGAGLLFAGLTYSSNRFGSALVRISATEFSALWDRWCRVHGTPKGVIQRAPAPATPRVIEADIADYSFDRVVVCDRARTVDLLIANNFHFENNCAVLSVDGYPQGPFETIRAMLKRNPKLQVYALHDATVKGCAMAERIAVQRDWFDGKVRVIDLGLRPRHAAPFRGLLTAPNFPTNLPVPGSLSDEEVAWLRTYSLELAAVRPEDTLKRLFHGMKSHANDDFSGGGTSTCGSFDSGTMIDGTSHGNGDGADSFG